MPNLLFFEIIYYAKLLNYLEVKRDDDYG
jgi:hypothetical protein